MGLLEGLLQRFQLLRGEGRAAPALLAVLRTVASLQDDVLKCAAVGKEQHTASLFYWAGRDDEFVCVNVSYTPFPNNNLAMCGK